MRDGERGWREKETAREAGERKRRRENERAGNEREKI